jgi:Ala-tRNA(Pro) deacylase
MTEFLDITPGSVSVMGLMNDKNHRVRLLIDKEVLTCQFFGCHPCINTSSLKLKTADLLDKFLPAIQCEYTLVDLPAGQE